MRPRGELRHDRQDTRRHSQLVQRHGSTAVVQQTKDDTLAVHRRDCGHSQVELARLEANSNAAVLRSPALGDVQLGEQLDTRHDRVMKVTRRFRRWYEYTVDAKPGGEPGARGLEMDVAGAGIVRVAYEQVHVADDRRLIREIAHIGREVVGIGVDARELDASLRAGRQPLHESLELSPFDDLIGDGQLIGIRDVSHAATQCVRS